MHTGLKTVEPRVADVGPIEEGHQIQQTEPGNELEVELQQQLLVLLVGNTAESASLPSPTKKGMDVQCFSSRHHSDARPGLVAAGAVPTPRSHRERRRFLSHDGCRLPSHHRRGTVRCRCRGRGGLSSSRWARYRAAYRYSDNATEMTTRRGRGRRRRKRRGRGRGEEAGEKDREKNRGRKGRRRGSGSDGSRPPYAVSRVLLCILTLPMMNLQ